MMNEAYLEEYWSKVPIGSANAYSYERLSIEWKTYERKTRRILHELSYYDNGDDLILIRSSKGTGFYRTNDVEDIKAYRRECLNRGRRTLVPLRKIDRVLGKESTQLSITNNLKAVRVACGLKASDVCAIMQHTFAGFDTALLSRMENDRCLPTPGQLHELARIYGCKPAELLDMQMYQQTV